VTDTPNDTSGRYSDAFWRHAGTDPAPIPWNVRSIAELHELATG
jgi:hypothetical protein